MSHPVAILVSDLHFSHNPPVARSAEPNWYGAMERQWKQLREEAQSDDLPVVIAGDIFDQWRSPPELINFVIKLFRGLDIFAIPGQHDLPNHVYADMGRSAYGTLIMAGAIKSLDPRNTGGIPIRDDAGLWAWSFPWGYYLTPVDEGEVDTGVVKLAVAHRYVWTNDRNKYPGAPDDQNLAVLKKHLVGYNAAVFGDNHKGFLTRCGTCNVINCGGFMARKSDERDYKPGYGVLRSNGSIEHVDFDRSQDKWLDPEDLAKQVDEPLNLTGLISGLESLGADALDFAEILNRYLDKEKVDEAVQKLVVQALQKGREDEA